MVKANCGLQVQIQIQRKEITGMMKPRRMTELTNSEDYLWFANASMNMNRNTNTNINTSKMMSRGMMTNGED